MRISEETAIEMLLRGGVIAIPTETVYGLAASIAHPEAIEEIFSLKGRPRNNPLIVHLAEDKGKLGALSEYLMQVPPGLENLVNRFWPGPLTLVLPVKNGSLPEIARAGLPTAAFRVPEHEVAQRLLSQTGPLVAPSANRSGRPSSTCALHVESDFGVQFPVVDGGICHEGVESTILIWDQEGWKVGRLGAIAPEEFAPLLGYVPEYAASERVCCPGQHYRHYAPSATLILGQEEPGEKHPVVIGFSDRFYPNAKRLIFLSSSDHPAACLKRLYHALRQLDKEQISEAWIDFRIPQTGLWQTLRERLLRAAQG